MFEYFGIFVLDRLPSTLNMPLTTGLSFRLSSPEIQAVWFLATPAPKPDFFVFGGRAPKGLWHANLWVKRFIRLSFVFFASVPLTYAVSRWMLRVISSWSKKILQVRSAYYGRGTVEPRLERSTTPAATDSIENVKIESDPPFSVSCCGYSRRPNIGWGKGLERSGVGELRP